ncbi:hypothetical protein N0V93_003203 [Gnomoniopsis smithogilvyi]|uniref:Ribonuclease H2 subunit B n=1 Tax=Gnomoniopsis smithogilvyi TaxID=1191159 RepID=A0A9W9CYX3_9PEZI|nr:hypothetical protein N0V93_003203 [Gnomoniopsis smithogilvyi]
MARTRATKATTKAAPTKDDDTKTSVSKYSLPTASSNPPKMLILPDKATSEARVVSLQNPRYSKPTRYLICPRTGAYEFIKIAAPKTNPRSWLIAETANPNDDASFETQVAKGADLYLATPIDPLFITLPALAAQFSSSNKRMFLSSDDHIETINDETPHLRDTIVRWPSWRVTLEKRMGAICDTVEAGDEELMYRFSEDKLLAELLVKAKRMSEGGLPQSMEDQFVAKALEAPILGVKRSNPVAALKLEESTVPGSQSSSETESLESQSSVVTTVTSASEASTAATSMADDTEAVGAKDIASAITASPEVVNLQRLRIAFNFICSSYVPPAMATALKKMLSENKGAVNFAPLEDYVAQLTTLRQEATMARSASDYSRKRNYDEENEERMEKKRKKDEEEKRKKAGESRGVRDLKKVNTSGMKKLSAFFKPKGS